MSGGLVGKRVLVVEDEMMVMLLIVESLLELGCEPVGSAATVNQALAYLTTNLVDIVLLDVNLNGCESYPIADLLLSSEIPFIFSTGYNSDRLPHAYAHQLVLRKPYPFSELEKALSQVLHTAVSHPVSPQLISGVSTLR